MSLGMPSPPPANARIAVVTDRMGRRLWKFMHPLLKPVTVVHWHTEAKSDTLLKECGLNFSDFTHIMIMIGTNDIELHTGDTICNNILSLFKNLRMLAPESHLAWVSILPRPMDYCYFGGRVEEINSKVKDALKKRGIHRVSAYNRFIVKKDDTSIPNEFCYEDDGLHPNINGLVELAYCINQVLFNLFRQTDTVVRLARQKGVSALPVQCTPGEASVQKSSALPRCSSPKSINEVDPRFKIKRGRPRTPPINTFRPLESRTLSPSGKEENLSFSAETMKEKNTYGGKQQRTNNWVSGCLEVFDKK